MDQQDKARKKERIDVLYLLKSHQAKTSLEVSRLVGRDYSTVKRWLRRYRQGGIKKLLEIKHQGGKSWSLPKKVLEALDQRLGDPNGFESYRAIQVGLEENDGLTINYSTLYGIVHHRLKAKPKVVRPPSAKRDESKAIEFSKKKLGVGV